MANAILPAATTFITDTTLAGTALPAAEGTSLATFTGFQFTPSPDGLVVVRITVGAAGAGNATFSLASGGTRVVALANSTSYILGPFDPAVYSVGAGIVSCAVSVVTGNAAGLYLVPASYPLVSMRGLHNPFEMVPGTVDR